jgi:4-methyl-5(b-hydroxyethyl)-thiazole monophosphate biosynthesis
MERTTGPKKVLVPVANGTEEIEAVCIIDTLRRAGAEVVVASVENTLQVTCSRQTKLVADSSISDCVDTSFDLIALPGGMPGAERLRDSNTLKELLAKQTREQRLYGAICASPAVVLQTHGLLEGRQATCYPNPKFVNTLQLKDKVEDRVVVDGNCVTSRGPGTALEFALQLVERLYGKDKADELQRQMLVSSY